MRFYLGFHHPHQLAHAGVPLFVSHRRLATMKTLPRAAAMAMRWGGMSKGRIAAARRSATHEED